MEFKFAERLSSLPPYLFAEIDAARDAAKAKGVDVVDLGVGDPEMKPEQRLVDALCRAARSEGTNRYSSYSGMPELRVAIKDWLRSRAGVELDPNKEILPLIGSKEGIGHMPLAFVNPGEEVLCPDPGYPVYAAGTVFAGGVPKKFPLRAENGFLPDWKELEGFVGPKTKMIFINYPNNPTTAVATREFFEEAVEFARKHGIILCQDSAYSELVYDGEPQPVLLEVEGAKDVALEFFSFSKTFSVPGWRLGFAAGNSQLVTGLGKLKTNLDSGPYMGVQHAGIEALRQPPDTSLFETYRRRRDILISGLADAGWEVPPPRATLYIWAPTLRGMKSIEMTKLLLDKAGVVCTPGVGFGEYGEGYVRFSLTAPTERIELAVERIRSAGI